MQLVTTFRVLVFVALASVASAGVMYVPAGPVSGKWSGGDSVVVASGAYVPQGEELAIEPGVRAFFEGLGRFEVQGRLVIRGVADDPVIIYCVNGWRGMRFSGSPVNNVLQYVHFSPQAGLARQAIEVNGMAGSKLTIENCDVSANNGCLRVNGGELSALDNHFTTHGLASKVVELSALHGQISPDCEYAPGNIFRGNFIKASVAGANPGEPHDPLSMTTGLLVDQSTNICLSENDIVVIAPFIVVGARFLNRPTAGAQIWRMHQFVIYSESTTETALGIVNEVDGDLEVTKSTLAVRGSGGYISTCYFVSRTAHILVNSSTAVLGSERDVYFNTSGVGQIDADYVIKWAIDEPSLDDITGDTVPGAADEFYHLNNNPNIREGDSVWTVNPLFAMIGDWRNWNSSDDIRRFFGLTQASPCIDRGDPQRGQDPDLTRWDIGHGYYDQSTSSADPLPGIVESSRLLAAYPNPFNPATVLPIEVARPGILRVIVWDILGRVVQQREIAVYQPGLQNVHFNGESLASGMYLAQAEFDGRVLGSQRLVLIK
ncbi:T9SS type A sorting domain-containing protein [bacterium]|nr:T9SS type A sorting domain-containing protein [bacterium]